MRATNSSLMEGLCHVVIGAIAETHILSSIATRPERIRIGVLTFETHSLRNTSKTDMSGRFRSSKMMSWVELRAKFGPLVFKRLVERLRKGQAQGEIDSAIDTE